MTAGGIPRRPQLQTRCTENPWSFATFVGPPRAAMITFVLHMAFSLNQVALCSNTLCKRSTMEGMHETARRLLAVGMAKGARTFAEIARQLGASDQSATNWKKRGLPKDVAIKAGSLYGVDAAWLAGSTNGQEPECVAELRYDHSSPEAVRQRVGETRATYALSDEETRLLDGYRIADDGLKRSIRMLADDALERFGRRKANHQ